MTDEQRNGNDPDPGDWFRNMMRSQSEQRHEASEAFAREQSQSITTDELLTEQLKSAQQVSELVGEVRRLRRNVRMASLVSGLVFILFVAAGVVVYRRPDLVSRLDGREVETNQTPSDLRPQAAPLPDLVLEADQEFKIRTDVDRKYQIMVRELYRRTRRIRRPEGSLDSRNAQTESYVRFVTDVLTVFEEATADQVSGEIMRALANLAEVGKKLRTVVNNDELDIESKNKIEQIQRVIQAADLRSASSD